MPIFKLSAKDGSVAIVVRAKCLSCARTIAVENAELEGTRVWRDPDMSTIELVRDGDRSGLILRSEKNVG